jgi:hypothetical protein
MFYTRDDWGARPPEARYRLDPDEVQGLALHWPAMSTPKRNVEEVKSLLRSIQRAHMDSDQLAPGGASDIAYQECIDQAGNRYQLRGLRHRSAANGGTLVNRTHGAILLALAIGERPSPAMVAAVRRRVARFRHLYPGRQVVVGHQDVRPEPTACPGPIVEGMIRAGTFEPKGNA